LTYRFDRIRNEAKPTLPTYKTPTWAPQAQYGSAPAKRANTELKPRPQYTGTYVIGIATMHKSNTVPVTNEQAAKDIARMRR
jgi:hypothetical protein